MVEGCPLAAFEGRKSMSWKDAVWLMNSGLLGNHWGNLGIGVFQFIINLIMCSWTSSKIFHPLEIFHDTLVGYYLWLFMVMSAHMAKGKKWDSLCIAAVTTRRVLSSETNMRRLKS